MAKIAYLDCNSGISGDMTLAALVDAGVPVEAINAALGSLALPGLRLVAAEVKRHGFRATQVTVESEPEHAHRHLGQILAMIDAGRLTDRKKDLARRNFHATGRGRGAGAWCGHRSGPFSRGGGGRFDRRHCRHGGRLGPFGS